MHFLPTHRLEKHLYSNQYCFDKKKGLLNLDYVMVMGWLYCKHETFTL